MKQDRMRQIVKDFAGKDRSQGRLGFILCHDDRMANALAQTLEAMIRRDEELRNLGDVDQASLSMTFKDGGRIMFGASAANLSAAIDDLWCDDRTQRLVDEFERAVGKKKDGGQNVAVDMGAEGGDEHVIVGVDASGEVVSRATIEPES